jgi:hypothetical protein
MFYDVLLPWKQMKKFIASGHVLSNSSAFSNTRYLSVLFNVCACVCVFVGLSCLG